MPLPQKSFPGRADQLRLPAGRSHSENKKQPAYFTMVSKGS